MGTKVVGVLVTVVLVGAGLLVRWVFDTDGDGDDGGGSDRAVHCVPELEDVCRGLDADVVIEDAARTFDRLVVRDAPDVVWVTLAPWPAMVDDERQRSGLARLFDGVDRDATVATSGLEWVGWTERLDTLAGDCGLTWECVVTGTDWTDHGGPAGWGRVQLGLEDPATVSHVLAVLGSASGVADGARVGTTDVSIRLRALVDLVSDPTPAAGTALAQMLVTGPAGIDLTVAPSAVVGTAIEGSARASQLERVPLDTAVVAQVQVVGPGAGGLRSSVASALLARGWDEPTSADGSGGLSGGAAIALWAEVQELMR